MKNVKLTQAFTIIELMVVISIILILAGLIVSTGTRLKIEAKKTKAKSMISSLEIAISMYRADTGAYPPESDAAVTPNTPSAVLYDYLRNEDKYGSEGTAPIEGWRGPYMEFDTKDIVGGEIVDPWGRAYKYDSLTTPPAPPHNTNSFDLWSTGPDGIDQGGALGSDDIYNW